VIVCGREIEAPVLEWIRTAAADLSPRKLAAQLCERLGWKGPGGQFQVSVAVGVLRRLQELKAISLSKVQAPLPLMGRARTPIRPEAANSMAAPQAQSLEELGPVELVRVGSRFSSDYRVWRQLLEQHHYLGSGPLAGHQLRYLVKGSGNWLGALAFSAAALQLKDRDQWIGWSWEARRENLPYVINNSRFLILPGLEIAGLASAVLALATRQVGEDWLEQFGYRPVLAETFVDLERYGGACYTAANWKPIGLTQGRGRQDPTRQKTLSKKLVLVYPLADDFRQKLCVLPEHRRLVPKPVAPAPPVMPPADWAEEEFGGCDLGDRRLQQRLLTLSRDVGARPTMSLPQACGDPSKTKAAYRFFDHPQVYMNSVLKGHYAATARRAQKEELILAVQDTTELSYSAHPKIELMGRICDKEGMIGMLVHDTMAYNGQGTPLGLVDVQCWTRDPDIKRGEQARYELPIEQKESYKWLASWKAAVRLQEQCPEGKVISIGDREADIYELLVEAKKHPKAKLLVRADQQRRVQGQEEAEEAEAEELANIWQWMARRPVEGVIPVELPRTAKRPRARTSRMEVRYAEVQLQPPKRKPKLGAVTVWVVTVTEVGPPPGEEPVDWKLITTVEVKTLAQALEVIDWYTQRFQIEVYHRTLKSGCKIEERQLGNAERIEGCLAIDMVVAWRIVHLTKLGREVPEVPCTVFFEEAQWKALVAFVTREVRVPAKPPTLREAILMMAKRLGGFLGRKCDGEPGAEIIWKALQRLDDITQMWLVMMEDRAWLSPTERELNSS
jgi:Domain of unknown function (DUF4338)/Transposase DNA-binding/Transposase Tn5 dimerisation domain